MSRSTRPSSARRFPRSETGLARKSGKDAEQGEVPFQNSLDIVKAHPFLQHGSVYRPKIGGHLQIAVIQIGQAGRLAVESTLELLSHNVHGSGCAVVCSPAHVLTDAASEFGENHDGDVVGPTDSLEVL